MAVLTLNDPMMLPVNDEDEDDGEHTKRFWGLFSTESKFWMVSLLWLLVVIGMIGLLCEWDPDLGLLGGGLLGNRWTEAICPCIGILAFCILYLTVDEARMWWKKSPKIDRSKYSL